LRGFVLIIIIFIPLLSSASDGLPLSSYRYLDGAREKEIRLKTRAKVIFYYYFTICKLANFDKF
jgi:hypothetical protein